MYEKRIFDITLNEEGVFSFNKTKESIPFLAGWAKIISEDSSLPLPSTIHHPRQLPGKVLLENAYIPNNYEIIIEAYLFDTIKGKQGATIYPWNYRIAGIDHTGNFFSFQNNWKDIKKQMREQGMEKRLLAGTKTPAALIRIAHAIRLGMVFKPK